MGTIAELGADVKGWRVGERVTVQYRQEKVDFRVAWVRRLEGTKEYQVGLEAVIPARDAWGLQVPSAIAFKQGHQRANSSYSEMMGTIRCDICGSEFLLGHRARCADPSAAEKQALFHDNARRILGLRDPASAGGSVGAPQPVSA